MPRRPTRREDAGGWVAVVGPGAVGGLLAATLWKAGHRVLAVGRDESWRRGIARNGLRVSAPRFGLAGAIRSPRLTPAVRPRGPRCRAVFVCVKARDLGPALAAARPLAGPGTAVVSLLNGVSHAPRFLRAFGPARTALGVCYYAAERAERWHVRHRGGSGIALARGPGNDAALGRARRLLRGAGWDVSLAPSAERLLWTKATFNAALNPLGALTNRTLGELAASPPLRALALRALGEAESVARACGRRPLYADMGGLLLRGLRGAPLQPNSMLQDLRAGRRTEIDALLGPFLDAARARRIETPMLEALHRLTRRLERELAR